jgi:hypothetical protein
MGALIFGVSGQVGFVRNRLTMELKQAGFDVLSVTPIHLRYDVAHFLRHDYRMPYYWFLTPVLGEGGPQGHIARIARKDEYRAIACKATVGWTYAD